ncbi:MAG: hypothetical protein AB1567_02000 [bacterium]
MWYNFVFPCRPISQVEKLLDANPQSEVYHYLYGRIVDDLDAKMKEFKKAIESNDNYFWGHYGL